MGRVRDRGLQSTPVQRFALIVSVQSPVTFFRADYQGHLGGNTSLVAQDVSALLA